MKLYIAEKPDIAKSIAAFLWPNKNFERKNGYYQKDDTQVSWAVGHILGLANPEHYGEEFKLWSNYPIIPEKFKLYPLAATLKQYKVLKQLLATASEVVHAGDPDREGQLLIDEILENCHFKGKVSRLLINAKDDTSLKRAFDNIKPNSTFKNLYEAGKGRSFADWLVGMNLSRIYTVNARRFGHHNVFRIGRVKIPTLSLVVEREKAIQKFKSQKYFTLNGKFIKDGIPFTAEYVAPEKYLDEENHIKDINILKAINHKLSSAMAIVDKIEQKEEIEYPPLTYSLDTLQVDANKKYGYSPKDVLDTVQSLYEKKYVSYPRSDCNYIPVAQIADAEKIIGIYDNTLLKKIDLEIKSKVWNDSKITAHHAIIPTTVRATDLNDIEKNIYIMIFTRYIIQFFKPARHLKTLFVLKIADETFKGTGTFLVEPGFKAYLGNTEKSLKPSNENSILPELLQGTNLGMGEYSILEKKTTPPKRFTEGTLIQAMSNIYKFVDKDNPNREKLKEIKGIGTPATRDTIIAELLSNKIKGNSIEPCLKKKGKELIPTEFGTYLIDNIDSTLAKPDFTASMELKLSEIAAGKDTLSDFLDSIIKMIYENKRYAEAKTFQPLDTSNIEHCPFCKEGILLKKFSKKLGKSFFVCNNADCVNPDTKKTMFYEDDNGKPLLAKCQCGKLLCRMLSKKTGYYWKCFSCNKTYNDNDGKPIIK